MLWNLQLFYEVTDGYSKTVKVLHPLYGKYAKLWKEFEERQAYGYGKSQRWFTKHPRKHVFKHREYPSVNAASKATGCSKKIIRNQANFIKE